MKLYQRTDGLWQLGRNIIPPGNCSFRNESEDEVKIVITTSNREIFKGLITELEKEDDSSYADIEELLELCGSFFLNNSGIDFQEIIGDLNAVIDNINGEEI